VSQFCGSERACAIRSLVTPRAAGGAVCVALASSAVNGRLVSVIG
jgi:hypothetical protein